MHFHSDVDPDALYEGNDLSSRFSHGFLLGGSLFDCCRRLPRAVCADRCFWTRASVRRFVCPHHQKQQHTRVLCLLGRSAQCKEIQPKVRGAVSLGLQALKDLESCRECWAWLKDFVTLDLWSHWRRRSLWAIQTSPLRRFPVKCSESWITMGIFTQGITYHF